MSDLDAMRPDWRQSCSVCRAVPTVPATGLCGPCTWGEADTVNGGWWDEEDEAAWLAARSKGAKRVVKKAQAARRRKRRRRLRWRA